jgi:hypothetical protein
MQNKKKKIMIAHFRVGMTDGVSLEIEKRVEILKQLGYEYFLLSGPKSKNADYIIEELDFDRPNIASLTNSFFNPTIDDELIPSILLELDTISIQIFKKLDSIIKKEKPDFIFIHNIFSHGRHIAASKAFLEIIEKYRIPTLGMHHDFYFERPQYSLVNNPELLSYLNKYIPPTSSLIYHAVINTIAQRDLLNRKGIEAKIITDTFNFTQNPWKKDNYNNDLLRTFKSLNIHQEDIILLQATRIVARKSIEFSIQLVQYINSNKLLNMYINKRLYNSKNITRNSKIHLLVVGYTEEDGVDYLDELKDFSSGLPYVHFLNGMVHAKRGFENGQKQFSLWDLYSYADAASYPSTFEGWGNQFIEAVFAKLPILCYEYPVFKTDIKPFGYNYISMGDVFKKNDKYKFLKMLNQEQLCKTSSNLLKFLFSKDTNRLLEENFEIGCRYHSYATLKENLIDVLEILNTIN